MKKIEVRTEPQEIKKPKFGGVMELDEEKKKKRRSNWFSKIKAQLGYTVKPEDQGL